MASSQFPRQDVKETEKNETWYKEHLDYAEQLIGNCSTQVEKMSRLYDSYNGKLEEDSIKYLVSTYGKRNRAKYIPYRLSKTKLDMLVGEFLKTPLNATVKTINSEAVTEKMKKYEFMLGAMHAKEPLEKLKAVGVDPTEGMEIPDKADPSAFSKMSFKDKNEAIMQIMLRTINKELNIHQKLSTNVQDCTITSEAYGRIMVNELTGDMDYEPIDPRDKIVQMYERDPFYKKTPIMGAVQKMPVNKILTTYQLSDTQRETLDQIRNNPSHYVNNPQFRNRYSYRNGEFCCDVIHIEWKSVRPKYTKETKRTERQLQFDGTTTTHQTNLSPKEYEGNIEDYNKREDVKVITEWEEDMHEAVRIGHEIDVNCRRKPFITRDEDTGKILGFSYCGLVFNSVDGETISLKEICENFDNVFDIIMYQILKEINKAKGKVIVYDRAGLPKRTTVKNVLYNALNDSFIDYDSSAAGNMSGKDLSINQVFREIDLGVSNSFQHLMAMKNDIVRTLDMITGITDARTGDIKASETVANAQSNTEASRTITEPLMYYLTMFSENVMMNLVETGKLVWGIYQPNKARMVLGDEKFKFLQVTQDLAFAAYQVELVNPRWEEQIRQRMRSYIEFSLNAKELRPVDGLDFELSETLADASAMLRKAWEDIANMKNQAGQEQMKADQQSAAVQQKAQQDAMREDREFKQNAKLEQIAAKGKVDLIVKNSANQGKLLIDQAKADNEEIALADEKFAEKPEPKSPGKK